MSMLLLLGIPPKLIVVKSSFTILTDIDIGMLCHSIHKSSSLKGFSIEISSGGIPNSSNIDILIALCHL